MQNPIRVLCVDDHPLILDGITFALQQQSDICLIARATNGREAIEAYREHRPDVTLMDLQMPQMSGLDAILQIRQEFPKARIVVLTTYSGDVQAARALKAGASGYLLKSMLHAQLVETIRIVYQGGRRVPDEIARELADHLGSEMLSARELDVLRGVAAGCSNKIVAHQLSISEDTVKGHMKNILAKLHANDRTHAVLIAMKRGFLDN